jgi:hypothetical protein
MQIDKEEEKNISTCLKSEDLEKMQRREDCMLGLTLSIRMRLDSEVLASGRDRQVKEVSKRVSQEILKKIEG